MNITTVTSPVRTVSNTAAKSVAEPTADEKKLRKAAADLEGLFVAQMYKAMRDTVPKDEGIVSGGSGEEIFTGLMDEHLAAETPSHWSGGIAEALYRQLSRTAAAVSEAAAPPASSTVTEVQTPSLRSR